MKSFLCELLFSCLLAAPGTSSIDELTYGVALFSYYQQDYDQALLDVLVAEGQNRRGDNPLRFELAEGSFAFKQGMYRYASETFAAVDPAELTDLDHMRLAFHLARERYRLGEWAAMEAELATIDLGANWRGRQRRHPEVSFMRAEAALARGDFGAAEDALGTLDDDDDYLAYGLFNLGVAYRQAGDATRAHDAFSRLARLQVRSSEAWDLVQRGRLALAVMARQTGQAVDAQALLGTLPGEGRYRDVALASYGNLAMDLNDHTLAARIWLTLVKRDGWSTSQAVAHLGLPMSLERLESPAGALDRYRQAEQVFERRLVALETASLSARDPVWVDGLLNAFAESGEPTGIQGIDRFDAGLGEETWLEWLAGEDVHRVMAEWRELHDMAGWLERLPQRVAAYQEITSERRRRTAAARVALDQGSLVSERHGLAERVGALEADLAALAGEPATMDPAWMGRLATAQERALIDQLAGMADLAASHMPERDRGRFEQRIRRLSGLVFWQVADDRSARIRELDKQLHESRSLLAAVDARMAHVAEAESRFAAGVETDFLMLTTRADDVSGRVAAALDARQRAIARALEQGLEREMAQTRQYLLTARIAIARATDQLAATAGVNEGES